MPLLHDEVLCEKMSQKADLGEFQAATGSTDVTTYTHLEDDDTSNTEPSTDSDASSHENTSVTDEDAMDALWEESIVGGIDFDNTIVSSANRSKGVSAEHLSKTWRIDLETAERTLDVTSQHCQRKDNPELSCNYGTNDRILRYKRVK